MTYPHKQNRNLSLNISFYNRFEANFGQQTVVLTFKCASPGGSSQQPLAAVAASGVSGSATTPFHGLSTPIKCSRKGNRMEIMV